MSVYLEKLAEFSTLLRREGLAVGMRETADACQILTALDLSDRETMRLALQAVYAKSREEQAVFQRCFDGFFVSVEQRDVIRRKQEAEARELAQRRQEAEQEMQVNGRPMDLREDLQEVYVRMGDDKRDQLRRMLEKMQGNLQRSPKLYSNFIRSVFTRFLLEQQMAMEDDAAIGSESVDPDLALLYRDISQFKDADIPRAAALIAAISRQLDAELSRRRQSRGHSGKLDFRRTIRKGLETGGSGRRSGGWCCCATCPAPCSSFPSLCCGSSSPCRTSPNPPKPFFFLRRCGRWTPSLCKIWMPSGITSVPPACSAGARTWGPLWRT